MQFFRRSLFVSLLAINLLLSCKQNTVRDTETSGAKTSIDSLVKAGKNHMNAHVDSLLPIATQLLNAAKVTGDKTALVYGEQFTANYYWFAADHKKSMKAAIKCLADAEKWGIHESLPETYLIIGNLHKENANFKMAFDAQEKGLKWAVQNHDTANIISLLGLRAMFIHSSRKHYHAVDKDTSIGIQLTALKVAESNSRYEKLRIPLYDNISQYYLDSKDFDKAIAYGEKGAAIANKYDQQRSLTYSYSWLGEAWFYKGDKPKGLDYLNKALLITLALKEPYRQMEVYEHLYDCYYSAGDYKTAIASMTRVDKMRDSLQVVVNEKQISELQIKYESVKKDNQLAVLDRSQRLKNKEIIGILAGSLLFAIFFIILILQYRILHQNNRIIKKSNEQKDKALESIAHIQAHELRKPVASIMGLINLIKSSDYELNRDELQKLEEASKQLDSKIRAIIAHAETGDKPI